MLPQPIYSLGYEGPLSLDAIRENTVHCPDCGDGFIYTNTRKKVPCPTCPENPGKRVPVSGFVYQLCLPDSNAEIQYCVLILDKGNEEIDHLEYLSEDQVKELFGA